MPEKPELRIHTIGHGNMAAHRLLGLLVAHDIGVILDVRSTPYSRRNPQYNREPFAEAAEVAGIRYLYDGTRLGGSPTDPDCYVRVDTGGSAHRETRQVDYDLVRRKRWFQDAVDDLVEIACRERVVLLCAEENPGRCHRGLLITPALLDRGVEVLHIRASGETEPARLPPEARQRSLF